MSAKNTNEPNQRNSFSNTGSGNQNNKELKFSKLANNNTVNKNKFVKQPTFSPKKEATGPKQPISGHTKSENEKAKPSPQHQQSENGASKSPNTGGNKQEAINKGELQDTNTEVILIQKENTTVESKLAKGKQEIKGNNIKKNEGQEKDQLQKNMTKNVKIVQQKPEQTNGASIKTDNNEAVMKEKSCIDPKSDKNNVAEHVATENCYDKKDEGQKDTDKEVSDKKVTGKTESDKNDTDKKDNDAKEMDLDNSAITTPQQDNNNEASSPSESKPVTCNKESTPTTAKTITTTPTKRLVTTCVENFEIETPSKQNKHKSCGSSSAPCTTSNANKNPITTTEVQFTPNAFSRISGRRALHPSTDYTPSKFKANFQYRDSYRCTEMDLTNSSLNVTVGSEIGNNISISSLERGRKREHIDTQYYGVMQNNDETEISPNKKPRMAFLSMVSSPLAMLRNRFSKTTLQITKPIKVQQELEENEDDDDVQNVSGEAVLEDIEQFDAEETGEGIETLVVEDKISIEGELKIHENAEMEFSIKSPLNDISNEEDIKMMDSTLPATSGNVPAKNNRCTVM